MKKVLTVTLSCLLATGVFAQTSEIKFGVKAGVNLAKIALSGSNYTDGLKDGAKFLTSFHFSGLVDVPISNSFSVQPGLSLSGKGGKGEFGSEADGFKATGTDNIMYLEVPVNAVFKTKGFYIGAGPYAAYAISGKYKGESTFYGDPNITEKVDGDLKFGSDYNENNPFDEDNDDYKSLDFGLNVLAGYQLSNGVNIGANYGLGLANLHPGGNSNDKQSNSVISVSVGFMF